MKLVSKIKNRLTRFVIKRCFPEYLSIKLENRKLRKKNIQLRGAVNTLVFEPDSQEGLNIKLSARYERAYYEVLMFGYSGKPCAVNQSDGSVLVQGQYCSGGEDYIVDEHNGFFNDQYSSSGEDYIIDEHNGFFNEITENKQK